MIDRKFEDTIAEDCDAGLINPSPQRASIQPAQPISLQDVDIEDMEGMRCRGFTAKDSVIGKLTARHEMQSPAFPKESTSRPRFTSRTRSYSLKMTETIEQQHLQEKDLENKRNESLFFKFGCIVVPLNVGAQF